MLGCFHSTSPIENMYELLNQVQENLALPILAITLPVPLLPMFNLPKYDINDPRRTKIVEQTTQNRLFCSLLQTTQERKYKH